ncbi:signal peptidase I [Geodermatophilus sp. SYSU D00697]
MPSPAPTPDAPPGSVAVHTLRRVASWVLGLVLLTGSGAALGVVVYPMVTGGAALAVLSGSMTPGLPVGGMVFTKPVEDPAALQVGDVITFLRSPEGPELVTHRIIAVDDSSGAPVFTTQGDANNAPDLDQVPASAVRGELWFSVAELGRAAAILHSPKGLGFLVVLVCAVLAVAPGPRPTRQRPDTETPPTDESAAAARPADVDTVHLQLARPAVPPPPSRIGLLD